MSFITIFTAPKPFTNPHIATIQRNALLSWKQLAPDVDVFLIGEEEGLAETAAELGLRHLPAVRRNSYGTPLISSMFDLTRAFSNSSLLAIINTDIILRPDFVTAARSVAEQRRRFMILGQRWDLAVKEELDFSEGWQARLETRVREEGRLHPPGGSDYFIFPRDCYQHVPDFAIGRAGWDNWMIYEARQRGWGVVDATGAINIVHQDHDYSHLPNGQPHYRLPETYENVRLAGGYRTIFGIIDSDLQYADGKIKPQKMSWKKFWREVEIFPLVRLHSFALDSIFHLIFHPQKAYSGFRTWLSKKRKQPKNE